MINIIILYFSYYVNNYLKHKNYLNYYNISGIIDFILGDKYMKKTLISFLLAISIFTISTANATLLEKLESLSKIHNMITYVMKHNGTEMAEDAKLKIQTYIERNPEKKEKIVNIINSYKEKITNSKYKENLATLSKFISEKCTI